MSSYHSRSDHKYFIPLLDRPRIRRQRNRYQRVQNDCINDKENLEFLRAESRTGLQKLLSLSKSRSEQNCTCTPCGNDDEIPQIFNETNCIVFDDTCDCYNFNYRPSDCNYYQVLENIDWMPIVGVTPTEEMIEEAMNEIAYGLFSVVATQGKEIGRAHV